MYCSFDNNNPVFIGGYELRLQAPEDAQANTGPDGNLMDPLAWIIVSNA